MAWEYTKPKIYGRKIYITKSRYIAAIYHIYQDKTGPLIIASGDKEMTADMPGDTTATSYNYYGYNCYSYNCYSYNSTPATTATPATIAAPATAASLATTTTPAKQLPQLLRPLQL